MNRALPLLGLIILLGCQEELSINEFEDEFRDYRSELRIEAILDPVNPWNSIVRVDRTILITDITIFDGVDNDSDWVAFTDENQNGKWDQGEPLNDDVGEDGFVGMTDGFGPPPDEGEGDGKQTPGEPHIDEYDEILPHLHHSTATVTLVDLDGNTVIDFIWDPQADSFRVATGPQEGGFSMEFPEMVTVTYGGYRPLVVYDTISYDNQYEFLIVTDEQRITGLVEPLLPPNFIDSLENPMNVDTIEVRAGSNDHLRWLTEPDATVVWILAEEVVGPDSLELVMSHGAEQTYPLDDGRWIGEHMLDFFFPGLYRWTITVPDRAYGAYFYSSLPMRDEQLSNLRDDDGEVVLGIAGSSAASVQYVRILE